MYVFVMCEEDKRVVKLYIIKADASVSKEQKTAWN